MAVCQSSLLPRHDRGRTLVDVPVMLTDGGEAIAEPTCCTPRTSRLRLPVRYAGRSHSRTSRFSPSRVLRGSGQRCLTQDHVPRRCRGPKNAPASAAVPACRPKLVQSAATALATVLIGQSSGPRQLYVVSLRCHELSPWTSPSTARLDRKPDDSTDNTAPMHSRRPSRPRKTTTSIATRLARRRLQSGWCPTRLVFRVARSTP